MVKYIKTRFLTVMLALALLLTACGTNIVNDADVESPAQNESAALSSEVKSEQLSGATVEVAQQPTEDELASNGIYGRVTAIDGDVVTLLTGNFDDGKRLGDADGIAPRGDAPENMPDGEMPADMPDIDAGVEPQTGVDISGEDGKKEGGRGGFAADGVTLTCTVSSGVSVTLQSGTQSEAASVSDIAEGDILIIDGEVSENSIIPTAVTIVRTPDAR